MRLNATVNPLSHGSAKYSRLVMERDDFNNDGFQSASPESRGCLPSLTAAFALALPSPEAKCQRLLSNALKSANSKPLAHPQEWHAVHAYCLKNRISFRKLVDTPLADGKTALQSLIKTSDITALHFVHTCLPEGHYRGDIYLAGRVGERPKCRLVIPGSPVTARGPVSYVGDGNSRHGPNGYGALRWDDSITYVGMWEATVSIRVRRVVFVAVHHIEAHLLEADRSPKRDFGFTVQGFREENTYPSVLQYD